MSDYATAPTTPVTPPDSLPPDPLDFVEQHAAERIPAELLIDIFTHIRPVYLRPRDRFRDNTEANKTAYQVGLAQLAALRLVDRFWNQTLTPVVHSEAVIFTLPIEVLQKSLKFLNHGAQHIKSLILVDPLPSYTPIGPEILNEARESLAQGLSKCSSSNIQTLECYGRSHTFIKREWAQKTLPNLTLTTKNLVFGRVPASTLSNALVNLGRSIQRLEIHSWCPSPGSGNSTFHLPAKMPLLQDVTLVNGRPPHVEIQKLFSRIGNTKKSTSIGHNSPLRFLMLKNIETLSSIDGMLTILRTNSIGKNLVSLFVEPPHYYHWPTIYPIAMVKECPLLVEFAYMFPVKKDLFVHFPPTLRHLHLSLYYEKRRMAPTREEDAIVGAAGFAEALRPKHYSLEKLQVSTCSGYRATRDRGGGFLLQESMLQEACDGAGVALVWSECTVKLYDMY